MGVLVAVDVGDVQAGALQVLDLGLGFAGNVSLVDGAADERLEEVEIGRAEGLAVGAEQGGDGFGVRDGNAVDEDEVTADAQRRIAAGDCDSVGEGLAGGHEGCGGERAGLVKLFDRAIDAVGEAEVVSVDDEANRHEV